jgi:hypothetical protein
MQTITPTSPAVGRRAARPSPYAGLTIPKVPDWAGLTAWDIWFNNLSIGVFLVAAVGALLAPASFGGLARYAYPLALLFLVVDLLFLVSSLGDPTRFHHMLRVFKLSSPMSFGTWALSLYGVLLGLASVVAVLNWPLLRGVQATLQGAGLWSWIEGLGKVASVAALLPAVGGILYKGPLFSVTSQPGWRDARGLGSYLANSAILLGCSVVLLLALLGRQSRAVAILPAAIMGLLLLDAVWLVLLYRQISATYRARYGVNQRMFAWIVVLVGGIIVPFILLLRGTLLIAAPPLLILPSALVARYLLMCLPHPPED